MWLGQVRATRCLARQISRLIHGVTVRNRDAPAVAKLLIAIITDNDRSRFGRYAPLKMVTGMFKTHRNDFAVRLG
jgi:hypothetical protein